MSIIAKYKPTKLLINEYIKNNSFYYKNNDFSQIIIRILYSKLLNLSDSQFESVKNNIINFDKIIYHKRIYNYKIYFNKFKLFFLFLQKLLSIKIKSNSSTLDLVFLTHDKYINYFKNSKISNADYDNTFFLISDDIEMTNLIDKSKQIRIPPFLSLNYTENRLLNTSINTYYRFKILFYLLKPKIVKCFEGDHPHQSIISLAAKDLNIETECYQWGYFYEHKLCTAFSGMQFTRFYSWGSFFTKQLRAHNPNLNIINFGRLDYPLNKKNVSLNSVLFIETFYNEKFHDEFIEIFEILRDSGHFKCSLRPHPSSVKRISQQLTNLNGVLVNNNPINIDLSKFKFVITLPSSAIVDTIYHRCIPVIFNPSVLKIPLPIEQFIPRLLKTTSVDCISIVQQLIENPNEMKYQEKKVNNLRNHLFR